MRDFYAATAAVDTIYIYHFTHQQAHYRNLVVWIIWLCVYVYVCVTITKKTTYIFFLHLFVIVTHTNQLLLSNSKFNDVWEHAKSQLNMYKLDV